MKRILLNQDQRSLNHPITYLKIIGWKWTKSSHFTKKVKIADGITKSYVKERVILKVIKQTDKYVVVDIVGQ